MKKLILGITLTLFYASFSAAASDLQSTTETAEKRHNVSGKVNFVTSSRVKNPSMKNTIVFFRPVKGKGLIKKIGSSETDKPLVVDVKMINKTFDPTVISIEVGSKINFTNADRVIHNAFSTTGKNAFDLGFYPKGESRQWTFKEPGLVKVYCNVHKGMFSNVMVLDTPYFATPDSQGQFQLDNLPAGKGTLFFWHPSGKTIKKAITVSTHTTTVNIDLKLNKRLLTKHKNKFGKAYRRNKNY